jgi:DNA-binding response OmpR family regulator
MHQSILLVENNVRVACSVVDYLSSKKYILDHAKDGLTASHLISKNHYDLIITDIILPGVDGFALCESIREKLNSDVPIILSTERASINDKLRGFAAGADDYLVKPFDVLELEARIQSQLRRYQRKVLRQLLVIDDLQVNEQTLEVKRNDTPLTLTPTGFKLLTLLMRSSPSVLSRRDMEKHLWGENLPDSDSLRSHIYNLRKTIDKPFKKHLIKTHNSSGYQIVA